MPNTTPELPPGWVDAIRGELSIQLQENGGELPADIAPRVGRVLAPLLAEQTAELERLREAEEIAARELFAVCAALKVDGLAAAHARAVVAERDALREALEELRRHASGAVAAERVRYGKPIGGYAQFVALIDAALSSSPAREPEQAPRCDNCRGDGFWRWENGGRDTSRRCPLCGGSGLASAPSAEEGEPIVLDLSGFGPGIPLVPLSVLRERLTSDEAVKAFWTAFEPHGPPEPRYGSARFKRAMAAVADYLEGRTRC